MHPLEDLQFVLSIARIGELPDSASEGPINTALKLAQTLVEPEQQQSLALEIQER